MIQAFHLASFSVGFTTISKTEQFQIYIYYIILSSFRYFTSLLLSISACMSTASSFFVYVFELAIVNVVSADRGNIFKRSVQWFCMFYAAKFQPPRIFFQMVGLVFIFLSLCNGIYTLYLYNQMVSCRCFSLFLL